EHREDDAVAEHDDAEDDAHQAAIEQPPHADRNGQADGDRGDDFHPQASRSISRNSMCSTAPSTVRNTPRSNSSGVPSLRPPGAIQAPVRKSPPCSRPITPAPAAVARPIASTIAGGTRITLRARSTPNASA